MSFLSKTLARVKPSPTIAVSNLAMELAAQGCDIISQKEWKDVSVVGRKGWGRVRG